MKNKFQSLTEKGRWLLATLTLIFTLGIGQMWGDTWTAANMAGDGTHKSNITVSSPGNSKGSTQIWKDGKTAKNEDAITIAADVTSSGNNYNKDKSYIEIRADRGYCLGTSVSLRGGSTQSSNKKALMIVWDNAAQATFNSYQLIELAKKDVASSDGANLDVTIPANMRTARIYRRVKIKDNTIDMSGTSTGENYAAIVSVTATAVLAPEIDGDSQMFKDETITLTGYPSGGSWAVVNGPGEIASDGKLTAKGNGTITVSYTVGTASGTKNIVAGVTKTFMFDFTGGAMPEVSGFTLTNLSATFDGANGLKMGSDLQGVRISSEVYEFTNALVSAKAGSTSKKVSYNLHDGDQDKTNDPEFATVGTSFAEYNKDIDSQIFTVYRSGGSTTNFNYIVITAKKVATYTVTFNNNGKGGDAPAAQSGITSGGKATEPTEPEDASYNFGGWYNKADWQADGAEKWNFGTSTVTKDTTLYAKWTDKSVPSTDATLNALSVAGCTFNETFDPATLAYTVDLPFYASMPVVGDVTATKNDANASDPVVSVSGNVISVEVTPQSGAGDKKTYTITVNIASTPTASSSINIEQGVLDYGKGWGYAAALSAAHIAIVDENELDSLNESKDYRNEPFLGLKFKKATSQFTIVVPASTELKVKFGSINSDAGLKVSVNGSTPAAPSVTSGVYTLAASAGVKEVVFTLAKKDKTVVLKQVMIGEDIKSVTLPWKVSFDVVGHANAVSPMIWKGTALTLPGVSNVESGYAFEKWNDGSNDYLEGAEYTPTNNVTLTAVYTMTVEDRMAELEFNGVAVEGFSPDVQVYNLTTPYAETLPQITKAVPVDDNANATIQETYWDGDHNYYVAQAYVIPAGGTNDDAKFYQVRFTMDPKLGATIFRADLTAANDADYSGMYADEDNSEINLSDDGANGYKFAGKSNYIKMALAGGTFAEGDMLKMTYTTNPQQGELAIYDGTTKLQGTAYSNHILTFSDAADGKSTLFIRRTDDNNFNGWVAQVEVQRYMAPIIKSYKIGAVSGTIDQDLKTIAIELPYGTSLYGVAATIEAYANGGATVTAPTPLAYDTPLGYKVSSAYAEDGDVDYTVTITEAEHYEAMIVGGANYETLAAAVAAAQADDVVKLLDNVDLMATGLTIAENITLDLNGFNIKAGEQIDNDIVVPAGKKLTLVDNSEGALGKIYTEQAYTGAVTGYGLVRVAGELLMQSGNIYAVIESDPANLGQFAVVVAPAGKVTVAGGQIKAGWYAISNSGNNTGSTIIVSGGELISTADFAIYNPAKESTVTVSGGVVYGAAGGIAMNRGELTVTGGTITSKDQGTTGTWGDGTGGLSNAAISASGKYESVEVEISGGTIIAEGTAVMITNGTTNPVEVAISGGQFSHVVPAEYCADGFAPVTTPNAQGKYEVYAVGIIHAAATQNSDNIYMCTLDNNVKIYASNSEGKLSTSTMTSTSSDVTACGGDAGGFNVNKSAFVLQFPVNVKEFTLFGANSNERTISKVYVNAEASADIKISTVGRELTGAYSNTKDEKCQTLTAVFAGENIIPANEYVLVTLSGSVNFYRVLYTEAECTTPTVAVADQAAKENVAVTLTAEASALGATYQWYTCDDALGTNPVIMAGKTAKTLSVTKVGTADQYYKVVVGCNCSAETAEAVAKVSLYTEATSLVDVTENTVWDWTEVTNDVDGAAITSDGKTVNGANGILANYLQGADWNKLESNNGAYAIRSNSNKYYQGASLHMHTTKAGYLKINARNDGSTMNLKVANIDLGKMTNSFKDYVVYVPAGDVVIENVPVTAGKPMRVAKITFTVDETPDYYRIVTNNIGTLCVDHNVVAGGALGATFYQIASRNEEYDYKIDFEEVLPGEELKAGEPYIFQSATGRIDLFFGETEAPQPVAVRGMIGNYAASTLAIDEDNQHTILYIAQNKLWSCENLVDQNLILNDHRAYIDMTQVPTYADYVASQNSNNAPRRRVTLGRDASQTTTGVDNLNASEQPVKLIIDGQLFIIRGEKMFDATGRLIK